MQNIVAFILGGGKGSRIYPLTKFRSKPAIPIGGKYRIIDIPISNCINSQIFKIFVLTQFNSRSLNAHINNCYRFDKFTSMFIEILSPQQTNDSLNWFQGTADAVRQNLIYLKNYPEAKHILIVSGDQLYRMDFRKLYAQHIEQNADVTIAGLPVTEDRAKDFGIMKLVNFGEKHSKIIDFTEKPQDSKILKDYEMPHNLLGRDHKYLASMGIYLFKREVLIQLLKNTKYLDFGREVIPTVIPKKNVVPYIFNGYWEDIGTLKSFHKANLDLLRKKPSFKFYDYHFPIYTSQENLPPAFIQNSEIENSFVADGSVLIDSKIKNSILGLRSKVGPNVEIENSYLMGADCYDDEIDKKLNGHGPHPRPYLGIGEGSIIRNAIIDKNVRIGKNVKIINVNNLKKEVISAPHYTIADGLVIIAKDAIIPDNTII